MHANGREGVGVSILLSRTTSSIRLRWASPARAPQPIIAQQEALCYYFTMTTAIDIEKAVVRLPNAELGKFRAWFATFDAMAWDQEFEEDAKNGTLDRLADRALADLAQGRCAEL